MNLEEWGMTRIERVAGVAMLCFATAAWPQEVTPPPEEPAPSSDAAALEQRLRILERKLELQAEQEAEAAKTRPVVSVGKDG